MPPFVPNTSGVKVPISTSNTLWLYLFNIIIKFPYDAHSDWLKQRALSENRERVDNGKLAFSSVLGVEPVRAVKSF